MRGQFFDIDERLKGLPAKGDDLERLKGLFDFAMFRPALKQAVPRADRSKGGRPPFDHFFMFKVNVSGATLGRVDGFDQDETADQCDEGSVILGRLLTS